MTPPEPLLGARALKEVLDQHGVRPKKKLGQNFVTDPNTIRKVVQAARISKSDRVIEVGAGAGSLTLGLAEAAEHVTAIEFDRALVPVLEETLRNTRNVTVVHGDALSLDVASLDANKLVGNLPYNIAATVVLSVLERAPQIQELTVMTQREVGERLAAAPGTKTYGQLSVLVAYFGDASVVGRISRAVFHPVPRVDSVLVRISRRPGPPPAEDRDLFYDVVKAAFGQRRKTIRNALGAARPLGDVEVALSKAGIDPSSRAETLAVSDFAILTRGLVRDR